MENMESMKHAKIIETEQGLPLVFQIDEGHRRVCSYKMEGGNVAIIFGVSNEKVDKPSERYKAKEGEETQLLCGIVVDKPEFAKIIGNYFIRVGEAMESERSDDN